MSILPFSRRVIDGVPTYEGGTSGDITAGIVFRVGIVDEDPTARGITSIVAELAATEGDGVTFRVDDAYTTFVVSGPPADVSHTLATVCTALAHCDERDLEDLADTIAHEPPAELTPLEDLVELRYGWQMSGLRGLPPLFAYAPSAERAREWLASAFTRANAVAFATGPLGARVSLPLADGPSMRVPEVGEPLCTIPAWCAQDWIGNTWRETIDLSSVVRTGTAQTVARIALATEIGERLSDSPLRSRTLAMRADGWGPCTHLAATLEVSSYGDVGIEAILGSIDDFIDMGPDADELDHALAELRAWASDPGRVAEIAMTLAHDELRRTEPRDLAALLDALHAVDAATVSDAMREIRDQLLLVVPAGCEISHPVLEVFDAGWNEPVRGTTYYRDADTDAPDADAELAVGDEGVTYTHDTVQLTARFDECVAALEFGNGPITLFAVDGTTIDVRPDDWLDGANAAASVRRAIPSDIVCVTDIAAPTRRPADTGDEDTSGDDA